MKRLQPSMAILGAGNMGTALAQALAGQGSPVSVWDHFPGVVAEIESHRENSRFLPGVLLHPSIQACESVEACVREAELVVMSVPSKFIPATLASATPWLREGTLLLNVAKGFAPGSGQPLVCHLETRTPGHEWVHLAGPCIANELVKGRQAFVVMASASGLAAQRVAGWFDGPCFSCEVNTDHIGAAFGGILKNVYAILLGCLQTFGGHVENLAAAAVTASIREMVDLAVELGALGPTLYGLSGLGDLVATGSSLNSHNRKFGMLLASGRSASEIEAEQGWLPEGVAATHTVCAQARACGLAVPLAEWVRQSIEGAMPTIDGLSAALRASARGSCRP